MFGYAAMASAVGASGAGASSSVMSPAMLSTAAPIISDIVSDVSKTAVKSLAKLTHGKLHRLFKKSHRKARKLASTVTQSTAASIVGRGGRLMASQELQMQLAPLKTALSSIPKSVTDNSYFMIDTPDAISSFTNYAVPKIAAGVEDLAQTVVSLRGRTYKTLSKVGVMPETVDMVAGHVADSIKREIQNNAPTAMHLVSLMGGGASTVTANYQSDHNLLATLNGSAVRGTQLQMSAGRQLKNLVSAMISPPSRCSTAINTFSVSGIILNTGYGTTAAGPFAVGVGPEACCSIIGDMRLTVQQVGLAWISKPLVSASMGWNYAPGVSVGDYRLNWPDSSSYCFNMSPIGYLDSDLSAVTGCRQKSISAITGLSRNNGPLTANGLNVTWKTSSISGEKLTYDLANLSDNQSSYLAKTWMYNGTNAQSTYYKLDKWGTCPVIILPKTSTARWDYYQTGSVFTQREGSLCNVNVAFNVVFQIHANVNPGEIFMYAAVGFKIARQEATLGAPPLDELWTVDAGTVMEVPIASNSSNVIEVVGELNANMPDMYCTPFLILFPSFNNSKDSNGMVYTIGLPTPGSNITFTFNQYMNKEADAAVSYNDVEHPENGSGWKRVNSSSTLADIMSVHVPGLANELPFGTVSASFSKVMSNCSRFIPQLIAFMLNGGYVHNQAIRSVVSYADRVTNSGTNITAGRGQFSWLYQDFRVSTMTSRVFQQLVFNGILNNDAFQRLFKDTSNDAESYALIIRHGNAILSSSNSVRSLSTDYYSSSDVISSQPMTLQMRDAFRNFETAGI